MWMTREAGDGGGDMTHNVPLGDVVERRWRLGGCPVQKGVEEAHRRQALGEAHMVDQRHHPRNL